jgi:spermidine/putrescine transport system permease protein
MTWLRKNLVLILGLLVLFYTFIPIFVVVLMSFNDPASRLIYEFNEFTLHN